MQAVKQGTEYIALAHLKLDRLKIKPGDSFTVTSPTYNNKDTVIIDRTKNAKLNIGKKVAVDDFLQHFQQVI